MRGSVLRLDREESGSYVRTLEAQLGTYIVGNHLKASTGYAATRAGSRAGTYAALPPHLIGVQGQLWF